MRLFDQERLHIDPEVITLDREALSEIESGASVRAAPELGCGWPLVCSALLAIPSLL
jgi:hypothetical protein